LTLDPGSGIFLTLDPGSRINIPVRNTANQDRKETIRKTQIELDEDRDPCFVNPMERKIWSKTRDD
jgi:hypothetical protein